MALGWPVERVHVIDTDLGQSGATADREVFQRLVTEVGLGRAGIVLGLEVSRLARNSTDSHRLLELCALSDTLILDEDGVYDPAHFNDRLLLGLKGTMSEAELHVLRARLRGGILSKARRGELRGPIPIGFVYGPDDTVVLDPDAQVLVEAMTPLALEVALTVQQELATRAEEADRIRRQHVGRARYEADLAQRRFLRVDPENRLVADALEAAWNDRLRALAAAQETYEQARDADARVVSDEQRAEILALATDFPRLWRDPATSAREKKRMMRLLITDVTLRKGDTLHADIRFTGGTTRSLDISLPKSCVELRTTDAALVREIDQLLDTYTDAEIADLLNERGVRTATMRAFTRTGVMQLRLRYGLKHRRTRLLEAGMLTPADLAARCGVSLGTVHLWRRRGLLRAHPVSDKGEYMYEIPPEDLPAKYAHKGAYQAEPETFTSDSQGGAV